MSRTPVQKLDILDALYIDAGWLTADTIADITKHPPDSVRRTLYKLRAEGEVESRVVELAYTPNTGTWGRNYDRRTEWRVAWHG